MSIKKKTLFATFSLISSVVLYGCSGDKNNLELEQTPAANENSVILKNQDIMVSGMTRDFESLDPYKAVAAGTKEVLYMLLLNNKGDVIQ